MVKNNRIIGIDPGTNILGFGVINIINGQPVFEDMGVIDMRKEKDGYNKLHRIFEEICILCDRFKPQYMALESPFMGRNAQVILKLGRAQGAAILAAKTRNIPVVEYAPRKAKVAITGNGAASKEQVSNMISKTLNIRITEKFLDATDALAIAVCHHYQCSSGLGVIKTKKNWAEFIKDNPDRIIK